MLLILALCKASETLLNAIWFAVQKPVWLSHSWLKRESLSCYGMFQSFARVNQNLNEEVYRTGLHLQLVFPALPIKGTPPQHLPPLKSYIICECHLFLKYLWRLVYHEDLFSLGTLERLANRVRQLILDVSASPWLGKLSKPTFYTLIIPIPWNPYWMGRLSTFDLLIGIKFQCEK